MAERLQGVSAGSDMIGEKHETPSLEIPHIYEAETMEPRLTLAFPVTGIKQLA